LVALWLRPGGVPYIAPKGGALPVCLWPGAGVDMAAAGTGGAGTTFSPAASETGPASRGPGRRGARRGPVNILSQLRHAQLSGWGLTRGPQRGCAGLGSWEAGLDYCDEKKRTEKSHIALQELGLEWSLFCGGGSVVVLALFDGALFEIWPFFVSRVERSNSHISRREWMYLMMIGWRSPSITTTGQQWYLKALLEWNLSQTTAVKLELALISTVQKKITEALLKERDKQAKWNGIPLLLQKLYENSHPNSDFSQCQSILKEISPLLSMEAMAFVTEERKNAQESTFPNTYTFDLFGGVDLLVEILMRPTLITQKKKQKISDDLIKDCLSILYNTCICTEGVTKRLAERNDFVLFLFTLMTNKKTFLQTATLIEDILGVKKEMIQLEDIPNLSNLVSSFDQQQLANFCRILAVTISELDTGSDDKHTLLAKNAQQKKNLGPSRAEINQATLLNIPGFIERLCKLATRKVSETTGNPSFLQELEEWYTWLDNALVLDALMRVADEETEQSSTESSDESGFANTSTRNQLPQSMKIMHEIMYKLEVLYVLCVLLMGRQRNQVHKMIAEFRLIPGLNNLFDKLIWRKHSASALVLHGHNQNCDCSPGVRGTALQWFCSYLNDRFQKVVLGDYDSAPWQLCHGVPQGSILSPLLFNVYMKPLGEVIRRCWLWNHQYADDTQLYLSFSTNPGEAVAVLNRCLAEVMGWMRANKLKLNPDKTEVLLVGGSGFGEGGFDLVLNGVALPLSNKVRSLGVLLDPELSLEAQVTAVVRTAFLQLRLIHQLRPYLEYDCLATDITLKIQFLRLLQSFSDHHENKYLLLNSQELNELSAISLKANIPEVEAVVNTDRSLVCDGKRGLLTRLLQVMKKEPAESSFRFWQARAVESFLRGATSYADQMFLLKRGLLEHILYCIVDSECKSRDVLQSYFDLLGELMKFNIDAFKRFNKYINTDEKFQIFLNQINSSLVDSNMLVRCITLSLDRFESQSDIKVAEVLSECRLLSYMSQMSMRMSFLFRLINIIHVQTLTQENVSCLNTSLVILMLARRKDKLPFYLHTLQEMEYKKKYPGFILNNFHSLLRFWQQHYLNKDKDSTCLENSSCISFSYWKETVSILLSPDRTSPCAIVSYIDEAYMDIDRDFTEE
ncbi:Short transient receptor potential channel 4-associated protein, partial [Varanus komodoensis]